MLTLRVIGLSSGTYLNLSGQLYVGEIIALAYAVLRFPHLWRARHKGISWPIALLALWALAQVISDAVNQIPLRSTVSTVASIGMTAVLILVLGDLVRTLPAARSFLFSLAVGLLLGYLLTPTLPMLADRWKFALALPALLLVAATTFYRPMLTSVALLLPLATANLIFGFRSMSLICVVAGVVIVGRRILARRTARGRQIVIGVLVIVAGFILNDVYSALASAGTLGSGAARKYLDQGSTAALFLSGRPEVIFAVEAIRTHWLFGIGSSAPPLTSVVSVGFSRLAALGIDAGKVAFIPGLLPLHSALPAAWATAGVAAPWFWLLFLTRCGRELIASSTRTPAAGAVLATLGIWDTMFSPFAGTSRVITATTVIVLLTLQESRANHRLSNPLLQSGDISSDMRRQHPGPTRLRR